MTDTPKPATKLPWEVDNNDDPECAYTSIVHHSPEKVETVTHAWFHNPEECSASEWDDIRKDYAYIVHACNRLPELEAENERARLLRIVDILMEQASTNHEHDLLVDVQRAILQYKRTKE